VTSERKIRANRANARASTGPKTARGRASSARNALRHGLTLPVCSDPTLSEEVETLAREIAGPGAKAEIQELARRLAEAQIDLRRVRHARHQFLCDQLRDPYYEPRAQTRANLALLTHLLRSREGAEMPVETVERFMRIGVPDGPAKFALVLSQETKALLAMDRYERAALLRRKRAIEALDEARRHRAVTPGNYN
jgi:hypothetical protein